MGGRRVEYVVRLEGLADAEVDRGAGSRALRLMADDIGSAETDIAWEVREAWPERVTEAASRLRDHFVAPRGHGAGHMQTGVRSVEDPQIREDFITVAPYAYDATFWGHEHQEVASLSDEGMSFVMWLTDQQRELLAESLGAERVVSMAEWRQAHPSLWRKWLDRLRARRP